MCSTIVKTCPTAMYGKVIGSSIAVDCFEEVTKNGIYFLTEGRLNGPLPQHVDRIYTSAHNAWLLRTKFQMDPDKIIALPINEKFAIEDKIKNLDFYVTLLDAKQRPGAVMFLFEGEDIGNVLYAGKCCYSDTFFSRPLCSFLKLKVVDDMYVHEACTDCHNHSMPLSDALQEVINIIRWNPNCKIVINEPCFREDILTNLKENLKKPICVSENIMKHLEDLGRGSDFILDQSGSQVIITDEPKETLNSYGQPVFKIILIPCSMKRSSQEIQVKQEKLEKKGYNVIFYRNHCSRPELVSLVRDINAKHTILIKPTPLQSLLADRKKDINYWYHLGNFHRFVEFFDRIQNETNPVELSTQRCDSAMSDVEVQSIVNITASKSFGTDNDVHVETEKQILCVLIDSDVESIASQNTVLNSPIINR